MAAHQNPSEVDLEKIVERFEDAWRKGDRPKLDDYLVNGAIRRELLVELIHTDLEYRLKAGDEVRVEAYLTRYPELAEDSSSVLALIVAEHQFRSRREPDVSLAEYERRFPDYLSELGSRLRTSAIKTRYAAPEQLLVPRKDLEPIPGYRLVKAIGKGGFGEVWMAEAPGGLHKAIKFVKEPLRNSDRQSKANLELKALNCVKAVRHPYILSLDRADVINNQLIIIMELADRDLMGRYRECRSLGLPGIPRKEMLRYLEEAAEALDLMNFEHRLQHLDIKPANLLLIHQHIKVADFGLVMELQDRQKHLSAGYTPLYSSPEVSRGSASQFSDQYSLAIVYQQMVTGGLPFMSNNVTELHKLHGAIPPSLSGLPAGDRSIVGRALAKNPKERFPSCGMLAKALKDVAPNASKLPPQPRYQPDVQILDEFGLSDWNRNLHESDLNWVRIECPECRHSGSVPIKALRRAAKCKKCGKEFTVS